MASPQLSLFPATTGRPASAQPISVPAGYQFTAFSRSHGWIRIEALPCATGGDDQVFTCIYGQHQGLVFTMDQLQWFQTPTAMRENAQRIMMERGMSKGV